MSYILIINSLGTTFPADELVRDVSLKKYKPEEIEESLIPCAEIHENILCHLIDDHVGSIFAYLDNDIEEIKTFIRNSSAQKYFVVIQDTNTTEKVEYYPDMELFRAYWC